MRTVHLQSAELGHLAVPPQFRRGPFSAGGEFRVSALRKAVGPADQMCEASLPLADPFLVHVVSVADENAVLGADQFFKRFLGAVQMHHEERGLPVCHHL